MATASSTAKSLALNSWKEIASYLGRGVRTVQRYERELGLPVRRPHGRSRSAVIALSDELDAWLRTAPKHELEPRRIEQNDLQVVQVNRVISESSALRGRCHELRDAHHEAMTSFLKNLRVTMQSVGTERRDVAPESPVSRGNGAAKPR